MIICSWDIGIKNLAFCIIEINNNLWEINEWDIITLENIQQCSKCNKIATYYDYNDIYFCDDHVNNNIVMHAELIEDKINCSYNKCNTKAKFIIDDKYYCLTHKKMLEKQYMKQYMPKPIKKKNSNKIPIFDLIKQLHHELEIRKTKLLNVNEVLIENQPTKLNPTMKTISSAVFSYFVFNGIKAKFISPCNKLKINKDNTETELNNTTNKKRMTKKLGIQYTLDIINNHNKKNVYISTLNKYKKKDDLCDSFLQCYHYLTNNKIIQL